MFSDYNNREITVDVTKIQKKGAKTWYALMTWYDENGKRQQKMKSTGIPLSGNNKREADKVAISMAEALEVKLNAEIRSRSKNKDILLSEWMYKWLEFRKNDVRKSTYLSYKQAIESNIKPYFDRINATLNSVTSEQIQEFYDNLIERGRTPNTVKHYHSYLSGAFKMAKKRKKIQYNPLDDVEIPKIEKVEAKTFTAEQLQLILDEIQDDPIEAAVWLGALCGLRRSEVLGLEWKDCDFRRKRIYIHQTRTNTVEEIFEDLTKSPTGKRYLPLTDELENTLKRVQGIQKSNRVLYGDTYIENDFVCVYPNGEPLKCAYVSKHFQLILNHLGLKGLKFHSLRHTVATLMSNSGAVNLKTVQNYLGHSSIATTSAYVHPDMEAKKNASNVLKNIISGEKSTSNC